MPSRREKKLEVRERAIFQAAAYLINRDGFAALTMDGLADEAGIAKATLYQHFKNKNDLVVHAVRHAFNHLTQFMADLTGPAIEQLLSVFRFMLTTGYDPDGFLTSFMHDDIGHLFRTDEQIAQQFVAAHQHLNQMIEQAKQDGDIAPGLANEVIITMMFNLLRIMAAKSMLQSSLAPNDIIDQAISIFRRGIHP